MDIENMHPFCLPFSLCHDATSSSVTQDDIGWHLKENDKLGKSNNNNLSIDREQLKSKGETSPTDDLFDCLDRSLSPPSNRPLLSDECLIDSSDPYHTLRLDIDMETDLIDNSESKVEDLGLNHEDSLYQSDDWFSTHSAAAHENSLFSPSDSAAKHRKSLKSSYYSTLNNNNNHQVFHVVDPIDIKSSPTLAQLNLNSNDDPTDSLWDTTTSTATVSAPSMIPNSTQRQSLASDLSTSCTSVSTNGCLSNLTTCNHLNHQHSAYASHQNQSHGLQACNHLYHHQHHHNSLHGARSNEQSTCLAVAPFRKNGGPQRVGIQSPTTCCANHHHISNGTPMGQNFRATHVSSQQGICSQSPRMLGMSSNDVVCLRQQACNAVDDNFSTHQQPQHQQCSSPAPLVTSSSSPLSSSTIHNMLNEERSTDSKLKENIEYLTVLLCNGSNKLEKASSQQQQSSISSTMTKSSYSTLAQSLATEPKLLGQHHSHQNNNHRQTATSLALGSQHIMRPLASNEASSPFNSQDSSIPQIQTSSSSQEDPRRISSNEWFRSNIVESSISAADSTAENQLTSNVDLSRSTRDTSAINGCPDYPHTHQMTNGTVNDLNPASRQGEMKVLSSLLNSSSLCHNPARNQANMFNGNLLPNGTAIWQSSCDQAVEIQGQSQPYGRYNIISNNMFSHNQELQSHQTDSKTSTTSQESNSIPPNGRPITLTPLVSNNVVIPQRQVHPQQYQTPSKTKAPTFAQPASPSASSTTSSSGITEISPLTPSLTTPAKRQKINDNQPPKTNERIKRPNSLSTDCSLSSHDEGFSSQVDQDDCVNSMRGDSDDDSDVDSDDESFYGDYSNSDLIGASISDNPECKWTLTMGRTRRNGQRRFFWQYNVQSKGPKGTRISSSDDSENPFILPEASDPVFSNDCQIEGVKHSGKARRGDGNDLTPNPKKLLMIGLELKKLSKIINDLAPVTDLPLNARNKTRKEKNKLASRACRLKKKAQHEANKIKLYGLQREHQQVVTAIYDIRKILRESLSPDDTMQKAQQLLKDRNLSNYVKTLIDQCSMNVAGKTSDYVNSVLEKVVSGFIDGGLQT